MNYYEISMRLVIACLLGGVIGFERENSNRPAGLRTHILVTVGSTLIMLISINGFDGNSDPARLAAQVVSGIGFLGAGTILVQGKSIYGLTTAASLWVCAGIGLAIGTGSYFEAVITVVIVMISLSPLSYFQRNVSSHKKNFNIQVLTASDVNIVKSIDSCWEQKHELNLLRFEKVSDDMTRFDINIKLKRKIDNAELVTKLSGIEGLKKVKMIS
ncbi:MAG: MgtC/SapB family protein [Vallitalea sp.]|jgi:putative Mg2+ transporter-C (MgtC) family protein|nr:MgtC/SapB family protein [Vallitalea sp.]